MWVLCFVEGCAQIHLFYVQIPPFFVRKFEQKMKKCEFICKE